MSRNVNDKNLSNLNLGNIEFHLNEGRSPAEIERILNRDPSGIRKEIKKYSSFIGKMRKCGNCLNKDICHEHFLCDIIPDSPSYKTIIDCELLKRNHHVCNAYKLIYRCKKVKVKYIANSAI